MRLLRDAGYMVSGGALSRLPSRRRRRRRLSPSGRSRSPSPGPPSHMPPLANDSDPEAQASAARPASPPPPAGQQACLPAQGPAPAAAGAGRGPATLGIAGGAAERPEDGGPGRGAGDFSAEGGWSADGTAGGTAALLALLGEERAALGAERARMQKGAEAVTPGMMEEVQELCELMGVPFVLAPSEAEAQCAELEQLGLVDGIITDDCDVFLFGGRSVFRNIFTENRYMEWYRMEAVEGELRLDRRALIHLALLLGSDYTDGVHGVGVVNAVEILRAFPGEEDLRRLRQWLYTPDGAGFSWADGPEHLVAAREEFARKHARVRRGWQVGAEFPSHAVVEAYLRPTVDRSTEAFDFGEPDAAGLARFCRQRFGWAEEYTAEVLRPVVAACRARVVQTRIDQFEGFYQRAARIRSKRVQQVVLSLTGGAASADMLLAPGATERPSPTGAQAKRRRQAPKPEAGSGQPGLSKRAKRPGESGKAGLAGRTVEVESASREGRTREAPAKTRGRRTRGGVSSGGGRGGVGVLEDDLDSDEREELAAALALSRGRTEAVAEEEDMDSDEREELRAALALSRAEAVPADCLQKPATVPTVGEYEHRREGENQAIMSALGIDQQVCDASSARKAGRERSVHGRGGKPKPRTRRNLNSQDDSESDGATPSTFRSNRSRRAASESASKRGFIEISDEEL